MSQELPFRVCLVMADNETPIGESFSYRNLRQTLRAAWLQMRGIPSAYTGIWWKGQRIAALQNNWRGELTSAEVYRHVRPALLHYDWCITTPLNPHGPIFGEAI
jgi:hypothetical protein